jgi:hypothetical protein
MGTPWEEQAFVYGVRMFPWPCDFSLSEAIPRFSVYEMATDM